MGAWDYGPFDNDGAWDCVDALAKDDPAKVAEQLTEAMGQVLDNEDYIENPEAQGAVAAAVLIANRLGAPAANDRIAEILEAHPFTATDELRTQALRVLDRLREPDTNEWHDLWLDSGALEKVLDLLAPYREVLAGTATA